MRGSLSHRLSASTDLLFRCGGAPCEPPPPTAYRSGTPCSAAIKPPPPDPLRVGTHASSSYGAPRAASTSTSGSSVAPPRATTPRWRDFSVVPVLIRRELSPAVLGTWRSRRGPQRDGGGHRRHPLAYAFSHVSSSSPSPPRLLPPPRFPPPTVRARSTSSKPGIFRQTLLE